MSTVQLYTSACQGTQESCFVVKRLCSHCRNNYQIFIGSKIVMLYRRVCLNSGCALARFDCNLPTSQYAYQMMRLSWMRPKWRAKRRSLFHVSRHFQVRQRTSITGRGRWSVGHTHLRQSTRRTYRPTWPCFGTLNKGQGRSLLFSCGHATL